MTRKQHKVISRLLNLRNPRVDQQRQMQRIEDAEVAIQITRDHFLNLQEPEPDYADIPGRQMAINQALSLILKLF